VEEGDVLNIIVSSVEASVAPLQITAQVVRTEKLDNDEVLVATVKVT